VKSHGDKGDPASTTLAVVGMGMMGSRVARRLLGAGYRVIVWNRTAAKTRPLVELGAIAAPTPGEASEDADAVITMVADPSALRSVVGGEDGIAASLHHSTAFIEMSTVDPGAITWLPTALPRGTAILDAPVLGSISEVESGTLVIFVSGDLDLMRSWERMLQVLGSPVHVGPLGTGTAAKLVANLSLVGVLSLLGEALLLADSLGLSREAAFEVLSRTPLAAQAERRRGSIEGGDYPTRFSLRLAHKDAELIVHTATETGTSLPVAAAGRDWFTRALEEGRGDEDYSVVLAHILRQDG